MDRYHSLVPLEDVQPIALMHTQVLAAGLDVAAHPRQPQVFPHPSLVYKAFRNDDGRPSALRRIVGYQLTERKAMAFVEQWRSVKHPNILALYEVFTCKDFGDQCT